MPIGDFLLIVVVYNSLQCPKSGVWLLAGRRYSVMASGQRRCESIMCAAIMLVSVLFEMKR